MDYNLAANNDNTNCANTGDHEAKLGHAQAHHDDQFLVVLGRSSSLALVHFTGKHNNNDEQGAQKGGHYREHLVHGSVRDYDDDDETAIVHFMQEC